MRFYIILFTIAYHGSFFERNIINLIPEVKNRKRCYTK